MSEKASGADIRNQDLPLVSIVTPCFNGEPFLERYFYSILCQDYDRLELIFVDDGSTDRTAEIAGQYKKILERKGVVFHYLYQDNAGQASALNRGLKLVTGKYMIWPDSDDELTPDSILKRVLFLERHQEYDFCVCTVRLVNDDDPGAFPAAFKRIRYSDKRDVFRHLIFDEVMYPGSFMVRTAIIDKAIPGREIYTGPGGQNPQILLPVSWYGNLGYMEDVFYIYHIRNESHSHFNYDSLKTIRQLENYESTCVSTIEKISEKNAHAVIPEIRKRYARRRFGTAIDTMNAELIRRYYRELASVAVPTVKERLLALKYTNPLFRLLYGIREESFDNSIQK